MVGKINQFRTSPAHRRFNSSCERAHRLTLWDPGGALHLRRQLSKPTAVVKRECLHHAGDLLACKGSRRHARHQRCEDYVRRPYFWVLYTRVIKCGGRWGVVQSVGHRTVNADGEGSSPSAPAKLSLYNQKYWCRRLFLCDCTTLHFQADSLFPPKRSFIQGRSNYGPESRSHASDAGDDRMAICNERVVKRGRQLCPMSKTRMSNVRRKRCRTLQFQKFNLTAMAGSR